MDSVGINDVILMINEYCTIRSGNKLQSGGYLFSEVKICILPMHVFSEGEGYRMKITRSLASN